jgi:hypothetical protein
VLTKCCETPLKPIIVLLKVFILYKVLALFVDTVICELVEDIGLCVFGSVLLTCEPNETLLVNVYPQRFVWCYKNVDSKIKLMAVYQQRVCDVAGDNGGLVLDVDLRNIIDDVYASSPRQVGGLDDPKVLLRFFHVHHLLVNHSFFFVLFERLNEVSELVG